ncbi:MAG: response regulator [Proteobacteria bacterium]|nr:response regulator [Pseudomonadota bacterium]MBU1710400.1 response regulator [Pseudomonadota bacterium]
MNKKVLFVDDDPSILKAIDRLFLDADIEILKAEDAKKALKIIQDQIVAVIFSDNIMPGMHGIHLLSMVRDISPDTVRILMTGYVDLQTAISAVNDGEIFKFIVKPWNNDSFVQTAVEALERYKLTQSLKRADVPALRSLAQTIELKDNYTSGHCDRVAAFAQLISEALGLSEELQEYIKHGAWLHDCGKIGVQEAILNSNSKLEDREWEVVRKHPIWGADVVTLAELNPVIVNIVHYHHERYDGKGYPAGLKGKDIPLEARIVAVADVFDAITTNRSYRNQRPVEKAVDILLAEKGTQFDAELVDIFIKNLDKVRNLIGKEAVSLK